MVTRRRFAAPFSFASLAIAFGIVVSAPSCGSGFLDGLSGGKREAGVDGGGSTDAPYDARTCSIRHPPERPDVPDSEVRGSLTFAVDAIRIDDAENADAAIRPGFGFDLDQTCTCPEPETCVVPIGEKRCDRDGGVDNALGRLFSFLGSVYPGSFGPDFATNKIRKGAYSALITLAGWNREANDPKVVMAVFLSAGFIGNIDGGKEQPKLDGTDVWTVDPTSVEAGDSKLGTDCNERPNDCFPIHYSSDAWVRDGVLYAKINAPFAIGTSAGRILLDFDDVQFVGRVLPSGQSYRLEGEFFGRWPVSRALTALSNVEVSDTPLCNQPAFYNAAKTEVCRAADLAKTRAGDGTGQQCGALSAVFSVTGVPAIAGPIVASTGSPLPCPPKEDDCSNFDGGM